MVKMFKFFMLFALVAFASSDSYEPEIASLNDIDAKDWWETASFYQIYPRSFKDSNGDGIGDLNGIAESLPYLKSLGIQATWLSPIFKSPMADFGYDISDFFSIQPEYGTMEDFDNLIRVADKLDIKIILDFVPNHSSDENEWFIRSENKESGFEDFYVWHPGYPDPDNSSNRLPPSNWLSVFRNSAWEFSTKRQEFYLHQFVAKQPDLNYRNPKVVETMKSVLRFWLDRGVSGFRIDAVPHLFEMEPDANNRFYDEPKSNYTDDPADWAYLNHIYTTNLNETFDMIYQWRDLVNTYKLEHGGETRVLLTEAYAEINTTMRYYGDGVRDGSHLPFNFEMIVALRNTSTAHDVKRVIDLWLNNMPKGKTANWVIGNHDNRRAASRYGETHIDLMNMLVMTLPGASVTYNGEEIGMTDVWISWNDTVDPAACNSNPSIYERFTRDPARTPFQWDGSRNAGFSTANKTWLPVSDKYKEVNVKIQEGPKRSHLNVYKNLINLRRLKTLQYGSINAMPLSKNTIAIMREYQRHPTYITVANLGDTPDYVDLTALGKITPLFFYTIVGVSSVHMPGQLVYTGNVLVQPGESFVLSGFSFN